MTNEQQEALYIEASAALIIYDDYLEVHQIKDGKVGPGKPCSEEAIKKLQSVLIKRKRNTYNFIKGIVPDGIIYLDSDTTNSVFIWRTEKHKQQLNFSKDTGITSGEAEVPNMIWCWAKENLTVYAYKEWKGMDTELFYVPLPNTNQGGVCLGNVKIKKDFCSIEDVIKSAMNYYWNSTFTHEMDEKWTNFWNTIIASKGKLPFLHGELKKETKYKLLRNFINSIE